MALRFWLSGLILDNALAGGGHRCNDSRLHFRAGGVRQGSGGGGGGGTGSGGESENYYNLIKQVFPIQVISVQNWNRLPFQSPDPKHIIKK